MIPVDAGFVYPKSGLDVDLRFDTTPTYVSTGSYFLDGTGDYIQTNGLTLTTDESDFSISFWMKVDESAQVSIWRPFGFRNSSTNDRIELWHQSGAFKLLTNNGDGDVLTTTWTVADAVYEGVWSHFAFSCDWNGSAMNATLYINGQSLGAVAMESDVDLSAADTSAIGGGYDGGSAILGNIAHFGVWHAALTQPQVRALMNASTYAEAVTKGGSTPRAYYLLEADVNISAGTGTGRPNGTAQGNAAPVGSLVRLPSGLDLTANQMNAQVFSGRTILFDASADWLNGGSVAAHVFTGSFSVSMWVKTAAAAEQDFLYKFSAGVTGYKLSFRGDQDPAYFEVSISDGTGWQHAKATEGNAGIPSKLDDGVWRHLVMRANNGTLECYVDGKVGATTDSYSNSTAIGVAGQHMTLGGSYAATPGNLTNGSLADIRIWNIALSAAQIAELRDVPEALIPSGAVAANLISKWDLSDYDISGDNTLDGLYHQDSGTAKSHAVANGCEMEFSQPSPVPQLGLRSSSSRILFDQTDDKVTVGNNAAINGLFGAGGSVAFWLNAFSDGEGNYGRIIETGGWKTFVQSESGGNVQIRLDHIFSTTTGTWTAPAASIAVGAWNHVVITYSGASIENDPVIYINGSSVTVTEAVKPAGTVNADTADKLFGNDPTNARTFHGFIGEVAFYKGTILDADAVTVMYNGGVQGFDLLTDSGNYDNSGDVDGLWVLSNPLTIQDLSTNSNTGTATGTPYMATIPEGSTVGSSAWGSLTTTRLSSGVLALPPVGSTTGALGGMAEMRQPAFGTQNFTIACWVRCDAFLSGYPYIYNFAAGSNEYGVKAFVVNSGGAIQFTYEGATTSQSGSGTAGGVGKWTFTAFQRLGAASFKLKARLIDSASWAFSTSKTVDVGDMTEAGPGYWGNYGSSNSICGPLAFPRVYLHGSDAAWSEDELNAIFEQGKRFLLGDS